MAISIHYLTKSNLTVLLCMSFFFLGACDDSGGGGLAPVSGTPAGMTAGTTAGMAAGATAGMTAGATAGMTAGMTAGATAGMTAGMTAGATAGMTAGNMGGTSVVPPMDEAGRCLEACLNTLTCDNSGILACGSLTSAAFVSVCQQNCVTNTATINSAAMAGCGSEANLVSALGLACEDDSLCEMAGCAEGDLCTNGQCSPFSCAPDTYDGSGNDTREQAVELAFENLIAENLTLCNGDRDWYTIDIPPNSSLRIDFGFKDAQADVDVRAYNEEGNLMFSSTSGTDNERLSFAPSDTVQRVWIEVFVFTSTTSEMAMVPASAQYSLYLSTNLPAPICQNTSSCNTGDLCNSAVGLCLPPPPCTSDEECGFSGVCDIPSGKCIDCYTSEDCSSGVCDTTTNECVSCLTNTDCTTDPTRGICELTDQRCVECVLDSDCGNGTCNENNRCIPASCMDPFEPNEDEMSATALPGTNQISGNICGDSDWFSFNANGGENLMFNLAFSDQQGDLELAVTMPDGTFVSRTSTTDNEILGIPNAMPGQYLIRVYGVGFQVNTYTLSIDTNAMGMICNSNEQCGGGTCDRETALCLPEGYCTSNRECNPEEPACDLQSNRCKVCNPDAFEPNDTPEAAIPANNVNGTLNTCNGPDFFAISAAPNQTIVVNVDFVNMQGDVDVRLYEAGDLTQTVASSAGVSDNENIMYLSEGGGTYFIEVYGYSDVYNEYTLSVTLQ